MIFLLLFCVARCIIYNLLKFPKQRQFSKPECTSLITVIFVAVLIDGKKKLQHSECDAQLSRYCKKLCRVLLCRSDSSCNLREGERWMLRPRCSFLYGTLRFYSPCNEWSIFVRSDRPARLVSKGPFQFVILAAGSLPLPLLTVHLEEDFLQLGAISCLNHIPCP